MRKDSQDPPASARGFTLIELTIVVAIILIMAAAALPAITEFLRNYKVNGALRDVSAEIQTARSQAIVKNTNQGVSFVIVDRNSYRFIREDAVFAGTPAQFGPLKDLPQGVSFVAGPTQGLRFSRLGASCIPGAATCGVVLAAPFCVPVELIANGRCTDAPGTYIGADPVSGEPMISIAEDRSGLTRRVWIGAGGRVISNRQ
jgi:prepilin-type N-terminal cleavage/methylation domain-containing protein